MPRLSKTTYQESQKEADLALIVLQTRCFSLAGVFLSEHPKQQGGFTTKITFSKIVFLSKYILGLIFPTAHIADVAVFLVR